MKSMSRPEMPKKRRNGGEAALKTEPEEMAPFRPQLSKKSLKMAERLGSASERLLQVGSAKKVKAETPSFQPTVNAVSAEIVKRKTAESGSGPKKWEQLYQLDARKREEQKHIEQKRLEEEEHMLKKHSFKPNIQGQQNEQGRRIVGASLVERTMMWEQNRQKKIKEKQQEKGRSDLEECTFRPTVVGGRGRGRLTSRRTRTRWPRSRTTRALSQAATRRSSIARVLRSSWTDRRWRAG